MIEAVCHCGAVRIRAPRPEQLTECNCSLCRRTGGRWAYYTRDQVRVSGDTVGYEQGDRTLSTRHCPTCGCITHWEPLDPTLDRMGVNARLMSGLAGVRIRHFDGADSWEYLD